MAFSHGLWEQQPPLGLMGAPQCIAGWPGCWAELSPTGIAPSHRSAGAKQEGLGTAGAPRAPPGSPSDVVASLHGGRSWSSALAPPQKILLEGTSGLSPAAVPRGRGGDRLGGWAVPGSAAQGSGKGASMEQRSCQGPSHLLSWQTQVAAVA